MEIKEAIQHTYLVRGLSSDDVETIASLAEKRSFRGGDTIVRQFGADSDLMIVLDGSARINTFSGDMIAEVGPGSLIGEVSLIDDQPRSATVVSVGGTETAVIPCDRLKALMNDRPGIELVILRNLSKVLCSRLRTANVQLDSVMAKP